MVVHLGLRTHELPYVEIGNIIADISPAGENAECYEEVANHSQLWFKIISFGYF